VTNVESDDSESDVVDDTRLQNKGKFEENEGSNSDDDQSLEVQPAARPYNALLHAFRQQADESDRPLKRRKVDLGIDSVPTAEEGANLKLNNGGSEEAEYDDLPDEITEDEEAAFAEDDLAEPTQGAEEDDLSDTFGADFASLDGSELSRRLKDVHEGRWRTEKVVTKMGTVAISAPASVDGNVARRSPVTSISDVSMKKRIADQAKGYIGSLTPFQQAMMPYSNSYTDLLVTNRTSRNASALRKITCLHALNHVLRSRDKVLKNTARQNHETNVDLDLRDQGFTRPKVLILLETRQMCAKYATDITKLFASEQQENKQRFTDSFHAPADDREDMPADFQDLFEGNNDNNFLTAIKFTRKTLKFYSPFYTSDIIFASPLGLNRILENEDPKKRDHDFLSSIEMVIVDQADAMYMQNWANVETVFRHLNGMPQETHGTDFSRVRSWYLDGHAKHFRQTIVFSAYLTPSMNRLFNADMLNVIGKAKLIPDYPEGAIGAVANGVKQTFVRFQSSLSPATDPDARFKYFTTTVLPSLVRLPKPADGARGLLIFIPSYYDFLRLRNFFATSNLTQHTSFGAIHEYSDVPAQRRARAHFLSGRHSILLYTQRAHHFFRLKVRGVKKVVMYGLPENAAFYTEMVDGFLGTTVEEGKIGVEEASARILFSRWDGLALERIVGTTRSKAMLGGKSDTFEFI